LQLSRNKECLNREADERAPDFEIDRADIFRLDFYPIALILFLLAFPSSLLRAQESPYIVTYNHDLEEPGNLEVEYFSTFGTQRGGNDFHAFWRNWNTALRLGGRLRLCGRPDDLQRRYRIYWFRLENRFRLLRREHLVNPVLYIEYGQISGADKILKEIEGHDAESNFANSNADLRREHKHELELKLLLSSNVKGWNVAVNPSSPRTCCRASLEFAYAVGVSRPLAHKTSPNRCDCAVRIFLREWNVRRLGSTQSAACMTHRTTSHRRLRGISRRTGLCVFRVASV